MPIKTNRTPSPARPVVTPVKQERTLMAFGRRILEMARRLPLIRLLVREHQAPRPLSGHAITRQPSQEPDQPLPRASLVKETDPEYLGIVRQPPKISEVKKGDFIDEGGWARVFHALRKPPPGQQTEETPTLLDHAYILKTQRPEFYNIFHFSDDIRSEYANQKASSAAPLLGGQQLNPFTLTHKAVMSHAGTPVGKLLATGGKLPEHQAREICHAVLLQLRELHSKGIIHRDIKLNNILINHQGKVTLVDFGMSKQGQVSPEPQFTDVAGTSRYLAPEVVDLKPYSHNADLWSLGMVLYGMLNGTFVRVIRQDDWGDDWVDKKAYQYMMERIDSNPAIEPEMKALLNTLLTLDPKQRPSAAEALEMPVFTRPRNIAGLSFTELQNRHRIIGKQIAELEQQRETLTRTAPETEHDRNSRAQQLTALDQQINRLGLAAGVLQEQLSLRGLSSQITSLEAEVQKDQQLKDTLTAIVENSTPDAPPSAQVLNQLDAIEKRTEPRHQILQALQEELQARQEKFGKKTD